MKSVGFVLLGVAVGVAFMAHVYPANESSCCNRVSIGGRDKISGYAGPFGGLVSGAMDATGLTKALPGLLDFFGVPA